MSKIKPFWRIVIGAWILFNALYCSSNLAFGGSFFGFAVCWAALVAYIFLCIKIPYDDPVRSMRDLMAQQAAEEQARREQARVDAAAKAEADRQALAAAREAERAEREAAQAEWDRKHGRIVTAIAGVTFKNDDGSSRQAILKDIKARGGDAELDLEEYEYKGKPAIRVLVDGDQIGNIPRGRVAEVSAILEQLEDARLEVETFRPEDEEDEDGNIRHRGELIYRADLYLTYAKE